MKVQLEKEWMGHPPGQVMDIVDNHARELIGRGTAHAYENKAMEKPPVDKNLKQSTKK